MNKDYVAGFVDGEGSLCIIRHNGKYTTTYAPHLSIVNTDRKVLEDIALWFGVGKVYLADKVQSGDGYNRRHCFTLNVHGSTIVEVLPRFMNSLIVKHEQGKVLLEAASLVGGTGVHITEDTRQRLSDLCDYIQWLNQGCL